MRPLYICIGITVQREYGFIMEHSPFAKLARELRNKIYEYALDQEAPFVIAPYTVPRGGEQFLGSDRTHALALTETCKEINYECRKLFYNINSFTIKGINTRHVFKRLIEFSKAIGEDNTSALRSVILDIGTLPLTSFEEACNTFDELQKFLARIETDRASWNCSFRGRANFAFLAPRRRPAVFMLDLDFEDIEKSWEDNTEAIRDIIEEDVAYWNKIRPMLETSRENLRSIINGSVGP